MEEAEGGGHEVHEEVVVVPRPQLGKPEGEDRRQQEERVEDRQAPGSCGERARIRVQYYVHELLRSNQILCLNGCDSAFFRGALLDKIKFNVG